MGQNSRRGLGGSGNWGDGILFTLHPGVPYFGHRGYEQKGTRKFGCRFLAAFCKLDYLILWVCSLGFTALHICPPFLILRGAGNTT